MNDTTPQMIPVKDVHGSRELAVLHQQGRTPGVLWMQGFMSDMVSTKASALKEWATQSNVALTRFDYSGHGQSGGDFRSATISQWLADSLHIFQSVTEGPQVVVGSSMGGFLAMLLLRHLQDTSPQQAERVTALVLIAPAWDMTEKLMWAQFPDSVRSTLMNEGVWLRPSSYGDPYPITKALIEDGRRHTFADKRWSPARPVRIIHGRQDPDVPFAHGEALLSMAEAKDRPNISLIEVPDGEHRLSRPQDLKLMFETIESLRA